MRSPNLSSRRATLATQAIILSLSFEMAVLSVACSGTPDGGLMGPPRPAPFSVSLAGTAEGRAAGLDIACSIQALIEVTSNTADGWLGAVRVGEVARSVSDGTRGTEFRAIVAGPASLSRRGGRVVLRFVGDQPPDARAFWRELEELQGRDLGFEDAEGDWSCAPVDVPGSIDTGGVVTGRWSLGVEP